MKEFLDYFLNLKWKAQELGGDSGERTYFRITSSEKTFIFVEHSLENKNFENFIHTQKFLNRNPLRVPQIQAMDSKKKYLLIEDLGDESLQQFYLKSSSLDLHKKSLDTLFSFQQLNPKFFKKKFDRVQGIREMITAYQAIRKRFKQAEKEQLFEEFKEINIQILQTPLVPSHRDFHSRNLLIHKGFIYMIDFQDAGLYPLYYDLVSLVYDSYVLLSEKEREVLLQYYEKKWSHPINRELLSLTLCQRSFKAIGSFFNFYRQRGQTSHLKYVRACVLEIQKQLKEFKNYPMFFKYTQLLLEDL